MRRVASGIARQLRRTRETVAAAARRATAVTLRTTRWVVLHGVVAAVSVGAGLFVVALAAEYGYHPVRNTATWASQPFGYAIAGACIQCHEPAQAATALGGHGQVRCEACHGPQEEHILAEQAAGRSGGASPSAGRPVDAVSLGPVPGSSASCLACHEAVLGRPRTFPMISPATHFGGATCSLCHDPHATTALTPPIARHDLAGLPACLVCHGEGGTRPMSEEHPVVTGIDCLACHLRRTD